EGVVHVHAGVVPAVAGEDLQSGRIGAAEPLLVLGEKRFEPVVHLGADEDIFGAGGRVDGPNRLGPIRGEDPPLFFGQFDHGCLLSGILPAVGGFGQAGREGPIVLGPIDETSSSTLASWLEYSPGWNPRNPGAQR